MDKDKSLPEEELLEAEAGTEDEQEAENKTELEAAEDISDDADDSDDNGDNDTGEDDDTDDNDTDEDYYEDNGEENEDVKPQKAKKAKIKRGDTRRFRYGGLALGLTAGAVAIIIVLNVLATVLYNKFPLNIDLTKDKYYTMNKETEKMIKGVARDIEIIIFADESAIDGSVYLGTELEELSVVYTQFEEMLKQFKSKSGGKISYRHVDLDKNPNLAKTYPDSTAGDVLFMSKSSTGNDRKTSFSLNEMFAYEMDQNTGSYYITQSFVEDKMSTSLMKVSSEDTPVIVLLTGYNEDADSIAGFKQLLSTANYQIEELNIASTAEFPKEAVMAVIPAPGTDYDAKAIERLDEWMINSKNLGHHLFVIANSNADCPKLYEHINANYQIEVTNNYVYEETSSKMIAYGMQYTPFLAAADLAAEEILGDSASSVAAMPFALQLNNKREKSDELSNTGYDLITFSETAKIIDRDALNTLETDEDYENKLPGLIKSAEKHPIAVMSYANDYNYVDNEKVETHVLVCGSSMAFRSDFLSLNVGEFGKAVTSALNSLLENEQQVIIESTTFESEILNFSEVQAKLLFAILVVVLPLIFVVAGITVFVRRRRL